MRMRAFAIGLVVLVVLAACQQPLESGAPPESAAPIPGESPAASPIAPAIEPEPTGPEQPIELPASPIAPAIEPGFVTPEPTLSFDPG